MYVHLAEALGDVRSAETRWFLANIIFVRFNCSPTSSHTRPKSSGIRSAWVMVGVTNTISSPIDGEVSSIIDISTSPIPGDTCHLLVQRRLPSVVWYYLTGLPHFSPCWWLCCFVVRLFRSWSRIRGAQSWSRSSLLLWAAIAYVTRTSMAASVSFCVWVCFFKAWNK